MAAPLTPPSSAISGTRARTARRRRRASPSRNDRAEAQRTLPPSDRVAADAQADLDQWLRHVTFARTRDKELLAQLVEDYRGYAAALAHRLHRDGEALDDLVQVAMEALLLSLQRFEPARSIPFMAFATPTIVGSLKRHYRDRGWALRVPRRVHDLVAPARKAADELAAELGRPARIEEIAERLGVQVETLLRAEEAAHARAAVSLDAVMGSGLRRADSIGGEDGALTGTENRLALRQALGHLGAEDQELLRLYFCEEWSQRAIGEHIGVSQMQVSRRISAAVRRLRAHMAEV
jgi:RNA polymerase sigma-B factor